MKYRYSVGVSAFVMCVVAVVVHSVVVTLSAQGSAPGGFVELATATAVRPLLTASEIAAFVPAARGSFSFPPPYGTRGYRLTVPTDCGGLDCVNPVGYSYWLNINNHAGSNTMYIFLGLDRNRGGSGPTLFSLNKTTGVVTKEAPLFAASDPRSWTSGEGTYFSASSPTMLYVRDGRKLVRYDVLAKISSTVFDIGTATNTFGSPRSVWQLHSSNDDLVHSFTVRIDGGNYDMLGCGVFLAASGKFKFYPRISSNPEDFDECQVDKSGRWLIIKENVDGRNGNDNRIIDLQTDTETVLLDENGAMGHSDSGFGYIVGADNWSQKAGALRLWQLGTSPLGPGTLEYYESSWVTSMDHISWSHAAPRSPAGQYICGSNAARTNGPRSNEIACVVLDGSLKTLVVAPVMTNLDAAGGVDDYNKAPKGNLDVTGQYFIWTSNLGGNRLDAFLVRIPSQILMATLAPQTPSGLRVIP